MSMKTKGGVANLVGAPLVGAQGGLRGQGERGGHEGRPYGVFKAARAKGRCRR